MSSPSPSNSMAYCRLDSSGLEWSQKTEFVKTYSKKVGNILRNLVSYSEEFAPNVLYATRQGTILCLLTMHSCIFL